MYKYLIDGGIFMWFILLASIVGFSIIIDRIIVIFNFKKNYNKTELLKKINTNNLKELKNYCKKNNDFISNYIKQTLSTFDENQLGDRNYFKENNEIFNDIMEEYINKEINSLEKGMWLLSSIVNASPQLGLLGTVTGMITSFAALMSNNSESANLVAGGIAEALYTTAFGLIISIPALIFYNFLSKKIDDIINEMYTIKTIIITKNCS